MSLEDRQKRLQELLELQDWCDAGHDDARALGTILVNLPQCRAGLDHLSLDDQGLIQVLTVTPGMDVFRINFVDGFAGGGEYQNSQTGVLGPGSPQILIDAVRAAEVAVSAAERRPFIHCSSPVHAAAPGGHLAGLYSHRPKTRHACSKNAGFIEVAHERRAGPRAWARQSGVGLHADPRPVAEARIRLWHDGFRRRRLSQTNLRDQRREKLVTPAPCPIPRARGCRRPGRLRCWLRRPFAPALRFCCAPSEADEEGARGRSGPGLRSTPEA